MDDPLSAQIVLFADFDSANMAKYERVVRTPAGFLNPSTTTSTTSGTASTGAGTGTAQTNASSAASQAPNNNNITASNNKSSNSLHSANSSNTGIIFWKISNSNFELEIT